MWCVCRGLSLILVCIWCFVIQNIELKVEVESLKKELLEKQELLKKAWYVIKCYIMMQIRESNDILGCYLCWMDRRVGQRHMFTAS